MGKGKILQQRSGQWFLDVRPLSDLPSRVRRISACAVQLGVHCLLRLMLSASVPVACHPSERTQPHRYASVSTLTPTTWKRCAVWTAHYATRFCTLVGDRSRSLSREGTAASGSFGLTGVVMSVYHSIPTSAIPSCRALSERCRQHPMHSVQSIVHTLCTCCCRCSH